MITGSDPRVNKDMFFAEPSHRSVTKKIEIISNLNWFDNEG